MTRASTPYKVKGARRGRSFGWGPGLSSGAFAGSGARGGGGARLRGGPVSGTWRGVSLSPWARRAITPAEAAGDGMLCSALLEFWGTTFFRHESLLLSVHLKAV